MEFDVKEIAKFLEQSVKDMQETEWSGCWYRLDNGLGICVYWCDGWGEEPREDVIQDKEHPDYGLVCGIKLLDEEDQSGGGPYFWKFPYFENGEVATEDTGIMPNEDFEALARQMLDDYNSVKDLEIDEDGLIHKEAKPEEPSEPEEESLKEAREQKFVIIDWSSKTLANNNSKYEELKERAKREYPDAMLLFYHPLDLQTAYNLVANKPQKVIIYTDHEIRLDANGKKLAALPNIEKIVRLDKKESLKKLKEDIHGGDVIDDLVDRAQSMLNDRGYGDAEDCVRQAIDDGLIYTADVLALLEYYGSIDDSTIIESYYDDLFSEVLDRLEEPEEEEEDEWEDDYEPEETQWDGDLEDEQ